MRSDDTAGPSLLLAQHDIAHREHLHQHHQFHNRRQTATVLDSTVIETVATVSYVQVIDVDANGSTFSVQTVLAQSTGGSGAALTEVSSPTTTTAASPGTTNPPSAASSTVAGDVSVAGVSLSLNSTSASTSVKSIPTSFTSLLASSNATARKWKWLEKEQTFADYFRSNFIWKLIESFLQLNNRILKAFTYLSYVKHPLL
jgi:hypothetical protein